uniref:Uncharacterized protein n=1 Tax=Amphilophus citrinellus TaxID=61819 RepID=A0A3Q0S4G3_AMPCI
MLFSSYSDISPCEKEDIGLLERALEKALRVRTGSEHSKKGSKLPGPQKEMGILGVSSMDVTHLSAAHRGSQRTTRSSSKSASLDRKGYRKPALSVCSSLGSRPLASSNPGQTKTTDNRNTLQKHPASSAGAVHQQASRKLQQVVPPSVSPDHITSLLSKNKTVRSNGYGCSRSKNNPFFPSEWKAWDQWKPEGGCFCPTGANGVVQRDGITSPLPLTIMYTTEAELQELERLRMRVALLQQEVDLEQVGELSSIVPGPGCPNPSVLRDVYSLLGEGGERFPAIVLDSEPA